MAEFVHPTTLLSQARLPTRFGDFDVAVFEIDGTPAEAVALMHGPLGGNTIPLVRLHSECLTGDVLGSLRCDCGEQLQEALALIASADSGVLLYLRQVRLLTNNPLKSAALERHGIQVVERVPLAVRPNSVNRRYLRTKADRMGHLLAL